MSRICLKVLQLKSYVTVALISLITLSSCSNTEFSATPRKEAVAPRTLDTNGNNKFISDYACNKKIAVSLVFDISGSMNNEKVNLIRRSAQVLVSALTPQDLSGLTMFNTAARTLAPMTHNHGSTLRPLASETIGNIEGNTDIGSGLRGGADELTSISGGDYLKVLILLSDGDHNTGPRPEPIASTIKSSEGVTIISIIALRDLGMLSSNPLVSQFITPFTQASKNAMKTIASSEANYLEATYTEGLIDSFNTIKKQLCRQ